MANNKITLTIAVDDKGSLKIVAKDAKTTAKAMDQVAASTDRVAASTQRASRKRNIYNKQEKGVGELTNNGTKAFSKQAQTVGGVLVPAYATLAANVFAVTAAFGSLKRAAATEQLKQGLIETGNAAAQNLPYVAKQLRDITGAAVSTQAAMSGIALGVSAGFSASQLKELTVVAKGASLALGRDMEDALTRLIKGAAKLEPEILDELGILVRLDVATQDYAATLGKTVEQLTQFEKRQGFLVAILDQGLTKFKDIAEVIEANPYDKLSAAFDDMTVSGFNALNKVLGPIAEFLASSPSGLIGVMLLFSTTITSKLVPALSLMAEGQREVALAAEETARSLGSDTRGKFEESVKSIGKLDGAPKAVKEMQESYDNATISVDKLKTNLVKLQHGEASRAQWITRWEKKKADLLEANKTASSEQLKTNWAEINVLKEKIALGEVELEQQREKIASHKTSIALSGTAGAASAKELRADTAGRMANNQAMILGQMAGANLSKTLSLLREGVRLHWIEVGIATGFVNKLAAAWGFAAKSAVLLGNVILKIIPILGLVYMGYSLIIEPLMKLWKGNNQLKEEMKSVTKSFDSFVTIGQRLEEVMHSNASAVDKFSAALNVQVGLFSQITQGYQTMIDKQNELTAAKISEHILKIIEARKALRDAEKDSEYQRAGFGMDFTELRLTSDIAQREAAVKSLREEMDKFDPVIATVITETSIAQIESMGDKARAANQGVLQNLYKIRDQIAKGAFKTNQEFLRYANTLGESAQQAKDAIDGARAGSEQLAKEINKLAAKTTTPIDGVVDSIRSLTNEFEAAGKAGNMGFTRFLRDAPEYKKMLEDVQFQILSTSLLTQDLFNALPEGLQKLAVTAALFFNPKPAADTVLDNITKYQEVLINTKAKIDELTVAKKELALIADANPRAAQALLDTEVKMLELSRDQVKTLRDSLGATNPEQKARFTGQIAAITAEIVSKERELYKIDLARFQAASNLFNSKKTLNKLTLDLQDIEQKNLEHNSKVAAIQERRSVGLTEQLNLIESRGALVAKNAEEEEANTIAQAGLDAGRAMLALQIQVINANGNEAMIANLEEQKALILETLNATVLLAEAKRDAAGHAQEEAEATAKAAYANKFLEETIRKMGIARDEYAQAGASILAAQATHNMLLEEADDLKNKVNGEIEGTLERLEAENDLAAKGVELQAAKLALLKEEAARARRLGGETFGTAADVGVSLTAAAPELQDPDTDMSHKMALLSSAVSPMLEQLKAISPEGEAMSAAIQGAFAMSEAFTLAFEEIGGEGLTAATAIQAVASTVSALGNIQAAQSKAAVAGIDKQIDAEQKRDGKSSGSLAKIAALEKKKESIQRKAFEQDKKMKMAQVVMATSLAVMNALAGPPGAPWSFPIAALVAVMGAAQLAAISSTSFSGGGSGAAAASTPAAVSVGERSNVIDLAKSRSPSGELGYVRGESGVGNGATDFTPGGFAGTRHRAAGGNTGFMVGEQGPELFVPSTPGRVIPADDVGAASAPMYINFKIDAVDATGVEDLLLRNRGNIIGMIREAANANGEFFLETVSTHQQQARNKVA